MKESDENLRSDRGYQLVDAVTILCIENGNLKLFEGNFRPIIKLHIIYFSLTDLKIRAVIILFSIHLNSIHTPKICQTNLCGICDLFI